MCTMALRRRDDPLKRLERQQICSIGKELRRYMTVLGIEVVFAVICDTKVKQNLAEHASTTNQPVKEEYCLPHDHGSCYLYRSHCTAKRIEQAYCKRFVGRMAIQMNAELCDARSIGDQELANDQVQLLLSYRHHVNNNGK